MNKEIIKWTKRVLFIFILISINTLVYAKDKKLLGVDTILQNVNIIAHDIYHKSINYEADTYIKGTINVVKRNILLKTIPYCAQISKNNDFYFIESWGKLRYIAPDQYVQIIRHFNTNHRSTKKYLEAVVLPHLQGNIYSSYLYNSIYSPLYSQSKKYYNFRMDSTWIKDNILYYKINFHPKFSSYQLAKGYMIINSTNWSIRELFIKGKNEFFDFTNHINMGEINTEYEFLPVINSVDINLKFFGNKLYGSYMCFINYSDAFYNESSIKESDKRNSKYDLTVHFKTLYDTDAINDFDLSDTLRPIPLTKKEMEVLNASKPSQISDTTATQKYTFLDFGKFITSKKYFDFKNAGHIEMSPIISPIVFNYSSSNGISYAQKLKYTNYIGNNKLLYLEPYIGFNFKYKEIFASLKGKYEFSKRKSSAIVIDGGTGLSINTDRIKKDLYSLPDTIFNPDKINLEKFRQTYGKIGYQTEIVNGLHVTALLGINKYHEIHKSDFTVIKPDSKYINDAKKIAKHSYYSFVPEVHIEWTPAQYYYMLENRKVPLYSKYPTFALNWAFAVKGVFHNSTSYHRVEFDVQQVVKLNLSQLLGYRFGVGGFINYSDLYFSDFLNFKRNIIHGGWDDEIGGVFQLLSGFQYN